MGLALLVLPLGESSWYPAQILFPSRLTRDRTGWLNINFLSVFPPSSECNTPFIVNLLNQERHTISLWSKPHILTHAHLPSWCIHPLVHMDTHACTCHMYMFNCTRVVYMHTHYTYIYTHTNYIIYYVYIYHRQTYTSWIWPIDRCTYTLSHTQTQHIRASLEWFIRLMRRWDLVSLEKLLPGHFPEGCSLVLWTIF